MYQNATYQQVTTNYQAWLPPVTLPQQSAPAHYAADVPVIPQIAQSLPLQGVTPSCGITYVISHGGTAVAVMSGYVNGGYITNPATAAAQRIATAENVYIDLVAPPGSTDASANGTTVLLTPGQNFAIPNLASGVTIWANAATSGHSLTVVVW